MCVLTAKERREKCQPYTSGDDSGTIKYWQTNLNNLKAVNAHSEPVRGVAFAPTVGMYRLINFS
jgi:WD40 repeat protein